MSNFTQHMSRGTGRGWAPTLMAVVVSACLAGLAGRSNGDEAKGPDLSTPKAAAVSFAKAVQTNDMTAVKAGSTGSDAEFKAVEAMAGVMASFKDFEAASVAKFGDAGKLPGEAKLPDLVAEIEKSEIKVEGEKATVVETDKPDDKNPMTLVKKDGKWLVDLSSMGPEAKSIAETGPKMKKALDDTTAEIKAGKHKTALEALAALGTRMQAANGPG